MFYASILVQVAHGNGRAGQLSAAAAMPLLASARPVCVLRVGDESEPDELEDGAEALRRHHVRAEPACCDRARTRDAAAMVDSCKGAEADLLVAGAYGRPGVQQWLFGGVSRELLKDQPVSRRMVH